MTTTDERIISEEYKIWKKNTPFLYDVVMTHALEWPSLTFQWLQDVTKDEESGCNVHRVAIGTHAVDEQNYLMIGSLKIPELNVATDSSMQSDPSSEFGGFGTSSGKLSIDIRICHSSEVNRARIMPQNQCIIATRSVFPEVLLFDYTRHPSKPDCSAGSKPELRLVGHKKEGYGMSWNPLSPGRIVSGADDGYICYWDISANPKLNSSVDALSIYKTNMGPVEDVSWSHFNPNVFISGGGDGSLIVWDTRNSEKVPTFRVVGHNSEIYCVSTSPFSENIFASGSADKSVALWDLRNFKERPVHELLMHTGDVLQVKWCPHDQYMLASAGSDRRINIWDLSRVGLDPTRDDLVDGPPELIFSHGGHTDRVSDLDWNTNEPLLVGSVADDNIIQFWKMVYEGETDYIDGGFETRRLSIPTPSTQESNDATTSSTTTINSQTSTEKSDKKETSSELTKDTSSDQNDSNFNTTTPTSHSQYTDATTSPNS